jgi:hypothetical protein
VSDTRSDETPPPHVKRRKALYYWRLVRQLPWLLLRYRL